MRDLRKYEKTAPRRPRKYCPLGPCELQKIYKTKLKIPPSISLIHTYDSIMMVGHNMQANFIGTFHAGLIVWVQYSTVQYSTVQSAM